MPCVAKLLISVAKAHENVLKYPAPSVIFMNFGASSLDFALRFWVKDYELGAATASDIRLGIEKLFREQQIEIAFPQLDVHVKDLPPRTRPTGPIARQPRSGAGEDVPSGGAGETGATARAGAVTRFGRRGRPRRPGSVPPGVRTADQARPARGAEPGAGEDVPAEQGEAQRRDAAQRQDRADDKSQTA